MRSPELTYQFNTELDTSGPTLQLVHRSLTLTSASVLLQLNLAGIPKESIFILSSASIAALPGAAQTVVALSILGTTPALNLFNIKNAFFPVLAVEPRTLDFSGEIMIHGSGGILNSVSLLATFNAGVAANQVRMAIAGYVIPRGNVAIF